ncbi:MAG TPA: ABC transporter substrate-binding protein [Mycobacteriales bacterium]|nr:ABC transporter substrate-binding protein [Mycobacteriales bacterium]
MQLGLGLAVALSVASACGGGGNGGGGGSDAVIVGTTDKVVSFDPAGAYDQGSWTPMWSMYQQLLRFDPGQNTPVPDAAKSCDFMDSTNTKYECTLRSGQKFWNGDTMTIDDVIYSFKRNLKIAAPEGASSLLSPIKSITKEGDTKVVFTLKEPFAVFPFVLADASNSIVDHKVFPPDKLLASNKIIGSGPYKMDKYDDGEQLVLTPSKDYGGDHQLSNKGVIVRYYSQATTLKTDIENGAVDVAYRTLGPTDIAGLRKESSKGVQVVEGQGAEISYWNFNLKTMPGANPAQKLAIRRAAAMSIDRAAIAKNAYNDTVTPLYSMVPAGLSGHIEAFKDEFGAKPDVAKAKQELQKAGVKTPVSLDTWYTPSHYGEASRDMYLNIQRQLDATGLFKINLKNAEWAAYSKAYPTDQYPTFQLGWFPDYPDSDDYVAPFYGTDTSFLNIHFSDKAVDAAITAERGASDEAQRVKSFEQIQRIGAKQVPMIPIWQGKQIAVQRKGVTGVEKTLDPSYTFRYWLLGK